MCVVYLGRLSEDSKVGLVAFATPLEDSDKVRVQVSVHLLPVHLQDDVSLTQLGTPWEVHDLFHHWAHGRLTCGRGGRKGEEGGRGREGKGKEGREGEGREGEEREEEGVCVSRCVSICMFTKAIPCTIVQWNLPSTHQCKGTTFMRRWRTNSLGEGMLDRV